MPANRSNKKPIRELMKKIYRKKSWNRAVMTVAGTIVFVTTYMLILPAITLTKNPVCGLEEHIHDDSCYQVNYSRVLECPYEALAQGGTIVVHHHDENCYDEGGNLICTLPEVNAHQHTAECYGASRDTADVFIGGGTPGEAEKEPGVSIPRLDEYNSEEDVFTAADGFDGKSTDHTAVVKTDTNAVGSSQDIFTAGNPAEEQADLGQDVFTAGTGQAQTVSTAGAVEQDLFVQGTVETDTGMTADISGAQLDKPNGEPALLQNNSETAAVLCGETELLLHTHTAECYDFFGNLICQKPEVVEHQHTDACFRLQESGRTLVCPIPEHTHTDDCYHQNVIDLLTGNDVEILQPEQNTPELLLNENQDGSDADLLKEETVPVLDDGISVLDEGVSPESEKIFSSDANENESFGQDSGLSSSNDVLLPQSVTFVIEPEISGQDAEQTIAPDESDAIYILGDEASHLNSDATDLPKSEEDGYLVPTLIQEEPIEVITSDNGSLELTALMTVDVLTDASEEDRNAQEEASVDPIKDTDEDTDYEETAEITTETAVGETEIEGITEEADAEAVTEAAVEPQHEEETVLEEAAGIVEEPENENVREESPEAVSEDRNEITTEEAAVSAAEVMMEASAEQMTEASDIEEESAEATTESAEEESAEKTVAELSEEAEKAAEELLEEADAEAIRESIAEADTETVTELTAEANTETITELTAEADTETVTEFIAEANTETVTEFIAEANTETVTELTAEANTETVTELTAEANTETVTEFIPEKITETITEFFAEPGSETVTEPTTEETTEAGTEVTGSSAEEKSAVFVMEYRGTDYTVRVSYGSEAGIPAEAAVDAQEIAQDTEAYRTYLAQAKAALGLAEEVELPQEYARFFDIRIVVVNENGEEEEIEPTGAVQVEIVYDEPVSISGAEKAEANVVHFEEEEVKVLAVVDVAGEGAEEDQPAAGEAEKADSAEDEDRQDFAASDAGLAKVGATAAEEDLFVSGELVDDEASVSTGIEFSTDSFSVYGIIYTFDFVTEDGGRYEVPGGEDVYLSTILNNVFSDNSEKQISNVQNVRTEVEDTINGIGILGVQDTVDENGEKDWTISTDVSGIDTNVDLASLGLKLVVSYKDGTSDSIDVLVTAQEEAAAVAEDGTSVSISAADGSYLPEGAAAKAENVYETEPLVKVDEHWELQEFTEYKVFDISLDGIETADYTEGFQVNVTLPEEVVGRDFRLFHIHSNENGEEITEELELQKTGTDLEDGLESVSAISFTTGNFSEFVLKYTVDFAYNGYSFSIYGGSTFALVDILNMLYVDVTDAEISNCYFTRPSKLNVYKSGDVWYLESTGAFSTEEALYVELNDGRIYVIKVTDAAEVYDGVTYGYLTDFTNSVRVTVNGTNLNNQQARDKTLNLTFNYSMMGQNIREATSSTYHTGTAPGGTYNWVYDLSEMVAQYPEIAEFPNMTNTIRNGSKVVGTYEVVNNKVYIHIKDTEIDPRRPQANGAFTLNMKLDEDGTGSEDSTTFKFPGGGSFTIKYKPVEYQPGTKSADPTSAVVYPDEMDDGYYFVDYTANLSERYTLSSLTFNDILSKNQELVSGSVKVNGISVPSVSATGSYDSGQQFSFDVLNALGITKLPANEAVIVTYTVRVKKETIDASKENNENVQITNAANWDIGDTNVPGGDTTVTIEERDYNPPTKLIKSESSYASGGTIVNPNGEKKDGAVLAKQDYLNADGTYHISYSISLNEGAAPKNSRLTDSFSTNQALLTDSFTVIWNGQKYSIPSSYIVSSSGSFTISDLKAAIKAATGSDFVPGVDYSINYETSVTAAGFDQSITNNSSLHMDKEYPSNPTTIELTAEDFQPGTKSNITAKWISMANATDEQRTTWQIKIVEPKKANTKAILTDTYPAGYMTLDPSSFKLLVNGTEYTDGLANYINTSTSGQFTFNLNQYLQDKNIAPGYLEAGVTYILQYDTTANTTQIAADLSSGGSKQLKNEADWTLSDSNEDVPVDGGEDVVNYAIPEYKETSKTDTLSGNVSRVYTSSDGTTFNITGDGPYTINYTITVPAQDLDLTTAVLTDTYTTNQTIDWSTFEVNDNAVSVGLDHSTDGKFTLNLLQALGVEKLEKGTSVTITYSATTTAIGDDITNTSVWNFDSIKGEYTDTHTTREKLEKPEYKPGSKTVNNPNANTEVTIGEDDKYEFTWNLTITEPGELTEAVLHDDFSASEGHKAHTLKFPITVTANGITKTITSADDSAFSWKNSAEDAKFDIDMITLFGVTKFPANTTFKVSYNTEATGPSVIESGTYHNEATWDFDGISGPIDDLDGGEADTTLKTKEYDDGTKTSYYEGNRLYGGTFIADGETKIHYVATIMQEEAADSIQYVDDWGNSSVVLLFPITVKDSNGKVIKTYASASDLTETTATGFTFDLVTNGKLPNGDDFEPNVTYTIEYDLDFSALAVNGDFDGSTVIRNKGHWYTKGDLPDHDDEHEVPDTPKSPEWKNPTKDVTDVEYEHESDVERTSIDKAGNDTWYVDNYSTENNDNGTFYITYSIDITEPRRLTSFVIHDETNIPSANSNFDGSAVLTITDANGDPVTWGDLLGNEEYTTVVENLNDIKLTKSSSDSLGFDWDVISYLNSKKPTGATETITIPKNYKFNLTFTAALQSGLETSSYSRLETLLENSVYATVNNHDTETDDADVTIKTRKHMEKSATLASSTEGIDGVSAGDSVDGKSLGTAGQGSKVKYTIVVGTTEDIFDKEYQINDTLSNLDIQTFDTASGLEVTYGNGTSKTYTEESEEYNNLFGYSTDGNKVSGFWFKIPANTYEPVTFEYYVTNSTQEQVNTLNENGKSIYGVQTETNTVTNPEDKTITTTYDVDYESDHELTKDFTKWDKETGTATWKVTVIAPKTRSFPKGYKITEEAFVYSANAPTGTDGTWTVSEVAAGTSMNLDLSKIIILCPDNNGQNVYKLGEDYAIEGNSIVFLKDKSAETLRITGIRTTIPNYNPEGDTLYYYNDASIRSDTDKLLDEDDDQNSTDAIALVQKKYGETLLVDDSSETGGKRLYFTWNITVTPPKGKSLKNYRITENANDGAGCTIHILNPDGTNKSEIAANWDSTALVSVRTASGVELISGTDYDNNGLQYGSGITFKTDIIEPVIITLRNTLRDGGASYTLLSSDVYKVDNTVVLFTSDGDVDRSSDSTTNNNSELTINKSVSGTEGTIEADGVEYPKLKDLGDNVYEYTVIINSGQKDINGDITFTDYLPKGFEFVDYNYPSSAGASASSGINYYDTELDVQLTGPVYDASTKQKIGNNTSVTLQQPEYTIDPVTGKRILPVDEATGRYKITLGPLTTTGWNTSQQLVVKYKVRLTEEEQNRLNTLKTGALQYYENIATASTETRSGTATTTVVYQYDEALKKTDLTGEEANSGEIAYEILVNAEGNTEPHTHRDLNNGEPLTLTDTIATDVELLRDTLLVYKQDDLTGEWNEINAVSPTDTASIKAGVAYSASYNGDTRKLILKLADDTSFKVVFNVAMHDVTPTDENGDITFDQAYNYINNVELTGVGKFTDSTNEKHINYGGEGHFAALGLNEMVIDKFDQDNIKAEINGATFKLYKVKEYTEGDPQAETTLLIPQESEWKIDGNLLATGTTGGLTIPADGGDQIQNSSSEVKFDGLTFAVPTGTGTSNNGWDENTTAHVVLYAWVETGLDTTLNPGYTIGDNAKPHYFIVYYGAQPYNDDPDINKAQWDLVESKKNDSSFSISNAYDKALEAANSITINQQTTGYRWPVQNHNFVSKKVIKLWDDNQNEKKLRPDAEDVYVQLYQDGVAYGSKVPLVDTTISASNAQYSYTWDGLPAINSVTGKDYVYTVEEVDTNENYVATYDEDTYAIYITNHLKDDSTVSVIKKWEDEDNAERKRPVAITYQLYQEDDFGNVKTYGSPVIVVENETYKSLATSGKTSNNFYNEWKELPTVDDPDEPTTKYKYFVMETKVTGSDGTTEYELDEDTNQFVDSSTGEAIYTVDITNDGNVFTATNTVVSSKTGSVKLTKTLTGLSGTHSMIPVDGTGTTMADEKTYSVSLMDSMGTAVVAEEGNTVEGIKHYNYIGMVSYEYDAIEEVLVKKVKKATLEAGGTNPVEFDSQWKDTFLISETSPVQIDGLPIGSYSYTAKENTEEEMDIKDYTFDTRVNGDSVTTVEVTPGETDPGVANLINNYIPDKGNLELTKQVTGLPEGTDLTKYGFPVTIEHQNLDSDSGKYVSDDPKQYVDTDGSLTGTAVVHYITPGTPYTVSNVPIGRYLVTELAEDSRMPDVTEGKTNEITEESLAHYDLDTDSSTLFVQGLLVTKNGIRKGTIINNYVPHGDLTVTKELLRGSKPFENLELNGEEDTPVGREFKVAVYSDSDATTQVGDARTITISEGTGADEGKYVGSTTFTGLPYGKYYVFELDKDDNPIKEGESLIGGIMYMISNSGTEATVSETPQDVVISNNEVRVKLRKRDGEEGTNIEGGEFYLYTAEEYAKYLAHKEDETQTDGEPLELDSDSEMIILDEMGTPEGKKLCADSLGRFYTGYLNKGIYFIVEETAPEGYKKLENPIKIVISSDGVSYDLTGGNNLTRRNSDKHGYYNIYLDNEKIKNGSLKLTKAIAVNGDTPSANDYSTVDGTYTFSIADADTTTILKYVQITVTDGVAASYKMADENTTEAWTTTTESGNTETVVVTDLPEGDYVITEIDPGDLVLSSLTRGDVKQDGTYDETPSPVDLANRSVTVHVTPGDTEAAQATAQAYFTNELYQINIKIEKVKANTTEPLSGAIFELYEKTSETGGRINWGLVQNKYGTDSNGQFSVDGNKTLTSLRDGTYQIKEIVSPTGYVITDAAPVTFTVAEGIITSTQGTNTAIVSYTPATSASNAIPASDAVFTVGNTPGAALPSTGGTGATIFYTMGVIMTMGAGLLLMKKRRVA